MKKRLRFSLTFTCLLLLCLAGKSLFAQFPQTLEIGPHGGITTYQGDINPLKMFNQFGYDYGGLVRYNYDSRWAFRLDYSRAMVQASDSVANWRPERGLSFRTKLHDVALIAEFNFFDYYTGRIGSSVSPYIFVGGSWLSYQTGLLVQDSLQRLQFTGIPEAHRNDSTHRENMKRYQSVAGSAQGSGTSFSIPFGIGCKLSLTQHLAASIEWRMHYTFTDDLDGIVRTKDNDGNLNALYPSDKNHSFFARKQVGVDKYGTPIYEYSTPSSDPSTIAAEGYDFYYDMSDPTGNYHEGQQRGDASTNDWFGMLNLSITWKIPIPGNSACKIIN